MVLPSGEQYEIGAGGYRAVVTECGAALRCSSTTDARSSSAGRRTSRPPPGRGQLLAPWPNRIRDGRYTFDDRDLQLPLSEPDRSNASHGLARWASWTLEELTPQSVSLVLRLMAQTGYPWTLDLHVLYDVSAAGLTITFTATNLSRSQAPYALGAHPYLTTGTGPVDAWELTLPCDTRLLVDDRMIPTGRESVKGTDLDFREGRTIGSTVAGHRVHRAHPGLGGQRAPWCFATPATTTAPCSGWTAATPGSRSSPATSCPPTRASRSPSSR